QNQKMSHPHTPTGACRISKLHINTHRNPPPPRAVTTMRARCSQPLSTNQTPHPTTKARRQPVLSPVSHTRDEEVTGLLSQSPIVCLAAHHRHRSLETRTGSTFVVHPNHTHYRRG